ncbi:MAG: hypothetical protein IKN29_05570 [Bacteroidales bacterium]|nr:hypothetical protein [Bacteroidales bacterium]
MGTSIIVYILSVVASLYATYLLAYCLYDVPDSWEEREPKRIVLPRIVYIGFMVMAFMPVVNTIALVFFVIMPQVGKSCGDFQIKSWLFEKPEVKSDNTDDNPEKK